MRDPRKRRKKKTCSESKADNAPRPRQIFKYRITYHGTYIPSRSE